MAEWQISTAPRMAMFLAQLAHESGELRWWEEFADGKAYENRRDLGNIEPGDGPRFKGRGPIQITGRANYIDAGHALGLNLVAEPEMASEYAVGFRIAGWFWASRALNVWADRDTQAAFQTVTRKINGGLNGYKHRLQYWRRIRQVLDLPPLP